MLFARIAVIIWDVKLLRKNKNPENFSEESRFRGFRKILFFEKK